VVVQVKWEIGMIWKERALKISDEMLRMSKKTYPAKESVLRRGRNPNALYLILAFSAALTSLPRLLKHADDLPMWFYLVIGLACIYLALTLFVTIYRGFTPLLKADRNVLISYGTAPWTKKEFFLSEITGVTFDPQVRFSFFRPVRLVSVQLENSEFRIWIPSPHPSPILPLRRMLQANFKEKYSESAI
jgi:hypothetical protein